MLAVAAEHQGNMFAASAETPFNGLSITKRAAGSNDWTVAARAPLQLPARTAPKASFAAVSPSGALWIGLRVAGGSGDDLGYGAMEIDLQTGLSVQHRPRKTGETAPIEALPLPADLNGERVWSLMTAVIEAFQPGDA